MADPFYLPPEVEQRVLSETKRRRAQFEATKRQVTPEMADRVTQIATQHPNASPGLVQTSMQADLTDEQVASLAAQDDGGWRGALGDVVGFMSGGVETAYEQAIKPVIRGAFTVIDTIAQEGIQRPLTSALTAEGNLFTNPRAFKESYDQYGDSAGLNILQGDIEKHERDEFGEAMLDASGQPIPVEGGSLGQGFFPGGGAQREAEQERTLRIGGNVANAGRALPWSRAAGEMWGYDSFAHNVVAGVSQFAVDLMDPTALLTGGSASLARVAGKAGASVKTVNRIEGGLSGARKVSRQLDAAEAKSLYDQVKRTAGAIEGGGRRSVLVRQAEEFFGDRNLLSKLAESDAYTIYQSFKRSSANRIDSGLIARLGNATDEAAVSEVLLDAVQRGKVTEKGFYSGLAGFRRTVRDTKLAGQSPRGRISLDDIDDAADKLDSFMRQANVDRETRASLFNRLIDINDPATPWETRNDQFFDVFTDAMAATSGRMTGELAAIKRATSAVKEDYKAFRQYGVDVTGDPILTPFIKRRVDPGSGVEILDPTPMITSQLLDEGFHLPDVTEVRRAAKRITRAEKLYDSKGWKVGSDLARKTTRDLFKPAAILRPAYVVRIGLEEQARLAAAGFDSIFNHPLRFIQANILAKKADTSLTGDTWESVADAVNAVNRSAYNVREKGPVSNFTARVWSQMDKPPEVTSEFTNAWRHELAQLSAAREVRQIAKNGDLDDFRVWARETAEGKEQVARIARINPEVNDILNSDDALMEWGESIKQYIAAKAGGEVVDGVTTRLGDADILDAIASGRVGGAGLADRTGAASVTNFLNGKFDVAPQRLKYDTNLFRQQEAQGHLSRAVDWMFDNFTGKPTNTFARYPAMRQAYIKNVRETMDAISTDELRMQFARKLDDMFTLTKVEKEEIARAVASNSGKKGFYDDLTELDEVLKVRSGEEVKELLFDVTKRSNVQDAYEVAVPFFDAWAEVTRTWARLVKENPAFFLRAGQGLESARDAGVVYANDHGEEVFAFPGGGLLSKFFPGQDSLRLEGRLQGANLVAQGVGPGFGPVVQWGVGAFMGKDKDLQQLREWLAPFGTGGIESAGDLSDPSSFIEAVTPAWARKAINAFTAGEFDPVQWNSEHGNVMRILANSGAYDPANPTDGQRLLADSEKGTRFVLLLRALTQGVAITGASATWQIKTDGDESETVPTDWDPEADPNGTWHSLGVLGQEYRRLREHYNYDDDLATSAFLDLYGVEPYYISQAKTRSLANLPVDQEGFNWVRDHGEASKEYQSTIGYFVPPSEDAPLDYSIYREQISAGDRQSLTAEQQLQLANKNKAYAIFNNVKKKIEGAPRAYRDKVLAHTRAVLEDEFPGWQADVLGVGGKPDRDAKITELHRAVDDPRLADSPVVTPLKTYFIVRQRLIDQAEARNGHGLGAQGNVDLLERLREAGTTLQAQNPAFAGIWTQLLSSEYE